MTEAPPPVHRAAVERAWIDSNGHMNMRHHLGVFVDAGDRLTSWLGATGRSRRSTVAVEVHLVYRGEARLGDILEVSTRVLHFDEKRMRLGQEMRAGDRLIASAEQLHLAVRLDPVRVDRFPAPVRARLARLS
jgi:carnitine 3-dehydrogenase